MKNNNSIETDFYTIIEERHLKNISGGNAPTLIAGACLIGMAAAGPIGCAGSSIFALGYYNGYESSKRGK